MRGKKEAISRIITATDIQENLLLESCKWFIGGFNFLNEWRDLIDDFFYSIFFKIFGVSKDDDLTNQPNRNYLYSKDD